MVVVVVVVVVYFEVSSLVEKTINFTKKMFMSSRRFGGSG